MVLRDLVFTGNNRKPCRILEGEIGLLLLFVEYGGSFPS